MVVALLLSALMAGDPDMEWSVDDAPAIGPAPTPAPLSPATASPTIEARTPDPVEPERTVLDKSFRLGVEAAFGVSPQSMGMVGLSVEFGWLPIPYLRLHGNFGGA